MRQEIRELSKLGPLPSEGIDTDADLVDLYANLLSKIAKPVTDEEAKVLVELFGSDDCYGLAWTLVHLIETAPNWPLAECLQDTENQWIRHLRTATENARKFEVSQ